MSGYFAAGWIFDYIREVIFTSSFGGFAPTTHQQLFIVSLVFEILLFPAIYFSAVVADGTGERQHGISGTELLATVRASAADTIDLFKRLLGQSAFYPPARVFPAHRFSQGDLSCRWTTSSRNVATANSG